MVDSPIDSQESDQDDANDEYPPDETETKRIEEVSEVFAISSSLPYPHSSLRCTSLVDSS